MWGVIGFSFACEYNHCMKRTRSGRSSTTLDNTVSSVVPRSRRSRPANAQDRQAAIKAMDAELYDRWYDTPRGRWIGLREATMVVEHLQPRRGESLLDVGCGTGFFTRTLAASVDEW